MSQATRREYERRSQAPSGHGYHTQYSESGSDDRFESGPKSVREQGYVPYQDSYAPSSRVAGTASVASPPRDSYSYMSGETRGPYGDRPSAPSELRSNTLKQMAPYDDAKADAERRHHLDQPRAYTYGKSPASDYGDRSYADSYDSRYDDDESDHRRERRSRRHSDENPRDSSDSKKKSSAKSDRVGAQLLGGAAGALIGQHFLKGNLGTLGGAVLGAIATTAAERQYEKHREDMPWTKSHFDDSKSVSGRSRSRPRSDPDHDRDPGRRDADTSGGGLRERLRSMSRSARSRVRSLSRPTRPRDESLESDDAYRRR